MLRSAERNNKPGRARAKNGTCPEIFEIAVADLEPATVNDMVYGVTDPNDPTLDELARLMEAEGQVEPIVVTLDDVVLSGHRRRAVALRLGWRTLKARRHPIHSTSPRFEQLLVTYNAQRDKSPDVRIREQLVLADPEEAYLRLLSENAEAARVKAEPLALGVGRKRSGFSRARRPFLEAARSVVSDLEDYWPLSDRRIHYGLLNDPPLKQADKPETWVNKNGRLHHNRYRNDRESYKALCDLLTRARLAGLIPFEAIGDETRPVGIWDVFPNVGPFLSRQVERFGKGYARDLAQSQPNHIEIVGEKMTVEGIVRPVAMRYRLPYTIGRGYSSLPPRKAMYDRYRRSGKAKLVIPFLTDHDPEGWNIAEAFAQSMRDDFGVRDVVPVKVALKPEQVQALRLPPNADAKPSSSRFKKFAARFGPAAYELEAVPPDVLQDWLDEAIRSLLNLERFNDQIAAEKQDALAVDAFRRGALEYLKTLTLD